MMGYDYYGYNSYPGHGWDVVVMVLIWVAIIATIITVVKWSRCHGGRCRHHHGCHGGRSCMGMDMDGDDDAMKILKERFARGEIDQREFEERKKALMSDI